MLGKASEIQITKPINGVSGVKQWTQTFPDLIVLQILLCPTEGNDYFYIVYKEYQEFTNPFEEAPHEP